ncbi:MAG TPA: PPC domain-containing DNA-binding protein [Thermoplasmata archaeon]|nr:PPC domain-containing DNA-binding protein [Thermoplasmata archaeon]
MQRLNDGTRWMLRLNDGDDLFGQLGEFATTAGVRAAAVLSGIGMLRRAVVGYWNGKEYEWNELSEPMELIALHGSIAVVEGAPSIHLHVGLADREHRLRGGHLQKATVGVLAEVYVETFPGRTFGRPMNESLGLRGLDLEPGPDP